MNVMPLWGSSNSHDLSSGVERSCDQSKRHFSAQKHLRWTIVGPDSSYSCLEIHICWKVLSEDRIEPPIHTEYLLGWRDHLDFHCGWSKRCKLLCHTLSNALKHRGTSRKDNVGIE